MIRALPFVISAYVLAACAQFPQIDAETPSDIGPRLALLPRAQLPLARQNTQTHDNSAATADLRARAAQLRAR